MQLTIDFALSILDPLPDKGYPHFFSEETTLDLQASSLQLKETLPSLTSTSTFEIDGIDSTFLMIVVAQPEHFILSTNT